MDMQSTPIEEARKELNHLYERKAKADSLDIETRNAYRNVYESICKRISLLEDVIIAAKECPAKHLLSMIREMMELDWTVDTLERAKLYESDIEYKVKNCELSIAVAYEQHKDEEAIIAISEYRALLKHINALSRGEGIKIEQLDISNFEEINEPVPFDD